MRVITHPATALIVVLVLAGASPFGFAHDVRFGYALLGLGLVVLVVALIEWLGRRGWVLQWPLRRGAQTKPEIDLHRERLHLQDENQRLLTDLRMWGWDTPARKYWMMALENFPDVAVGAARQIFQLLDYAYRYPFVDVPLTCKAMDPDQPDIYTVDLYPIQYVFKRAEGEAMILRSRLRKLVDDAKQDAYIDAKLKQPE